MNSIAQKSGWTEVKTCPVCGHRGWCAIDDLGEVCKCMRVAEGAFKHAEDGAGLAHFHRLLESATPPPRPHPRPKAPAEDWAKVHERCRADITRELVDWLSLDLMVSMQSLHAVGVGWHAERRCFTFPERSADGSIVGIATRRHDGAKRFLPGGHRGLIIPLGLNLAEPVLIVEGPSDVAACLTLGLRAVGRPSNTGGVPMLAELLSEAREVYVIGEADGGPGIDGAKRTAAKLAEAWGRRVPWCLPPHGAKDIRGWLYEHDAHTAEELREVLL